MDPVDETMRDTFFAAILGKEEVDEDFHKILGHIVKRDRLGITEPRKSAKSSYST